MIGVHLLDYRFWINLVLAVTMQWFITLWVGVIRPQNWKLPLKWIGWGLIPAILGRPWTLILPPLSALVYLIRHRPKLTLIFVNATIVIYLVVVMVNDVVRQVIVELIGVAGSEQPLVIAGRLIFQLLIYSLISLAVSGMRVQPGNLERLSFSRKEQWTVMALLTSLAILAQASSMIIHRLKINHAMLTFALSIELVMVLLISASLFFFLQSFFDRQHVRAKFQENLLQTRYDRRISNQVQAIREFKQTYQKQMLKLGDYLDAEDYEGLAAYYETLNSRWQATSLRAGIEVDGLHQLSDPALKSLLFQKMLAAQNHGIAFQLEIPDKVAVLPMESVHLLRVVGVLLDNAIEACAGQSQPEIYCAILDYPGVVEFAVANPVPADTPGKMSHFMEAGYTTKGGGHGLGLSSVQEIINQTDNASLQVVYKRGMLYFTVILTKPGR